MIVGLCVAFFFAEHNVDVECELSGEVQSDRDPDKGIKIEFHFLKEGLGIPLPFSRRKLQ